MAPRRAASLCLLLLLCVLADARLSLDYYKDSCPNLQQIVQDTVVNKQIANPTTAGAALRLFFHDCFVEGCDASVLVSSNPRNKAERDADINLSLPGDGFDIVIRTKAALELACPGVVSCADILVLVTRNLVKMVGGPYYNVYFGRKDGLISHAENAERELPKATTPLSEMISMFTQKGFTVQELVALSGAHTIGFSHCKEFAPRIYNYGRGMSHDPSLNPRFADALRNACASYKADPTMSVFNDVISPGKFDNSYYQNLPRGLGLLSSDSILYRDARTRPYVELYAANQTAFFEAFGHAMEKLSFFGIKTGRKGEVRSRCDTFNSLS
ncbi:peroxidase 31-like [Aristolochia californica]|uniref:peroxidase 31-like n=1 Tax=Aristolochia californica TaxID=171875 RepID=UPI0035E39C4C